MFDREVVARGKKQCFKKKKLHGYENYYFHLGSKTYFFLGQPI